VPNTAEQVIPVAGSHFPTPDNVRAAVKVYVDAGLEIVELTEVYFHFRKGKREAAGNMKMPLKQVVLQAQLLMPVDTVAPPQS
jgi:hypothetical protein